MKISETIDVIWELAAREAIAAQFKEIEPEQFFLAILKFSEIPLKELEKTIPLKDTGIELSNAIKIICQGLKKLGIESTPARRRLRAKLRRPVCSVGQPRQYAAVVGAYLGTQLSRSG